MKKKFKTVLLLLLSVLLILPAGSVSFGDAVLIGDVDGDGEITPQDANHITRYLAHFETLDAAQLSRADFDGDGQITAYDATLILSSIVATEDRSKILWNCSMIITSDLKGEAWGSMSEGQTGYASALNLVSFVNEEREKDPNVLLIDAGGSLLGSAITDEYKTYTKKHIGPMTLIFQNLKYNGVMLGPEVIQNQAQMIRNEMDALTMKGIPVFGTNITKVYPLINDPEYAPWNDIVQCLILEVPQENGKPVRVGMIGIIEPDLADIRDEVQIDDPLPCFEKVRAKLREKCDLTLLFYYGSVESDESKPEIYSLRKYLRQISDIDLVLVSHGVGDNIRTGQDGRGKEVPIIALPDGAQNAFKLSVAKRENGAIAFLTEKVDLHAYAPDEQTKRQIKPYVTGMSEMMDARVGVLKEQIEPFAPDTLGMTDGMELLHEMQLWGARKWIETSGLDLPQNLVSIAYPYLSTTGWNAGTVRYRDICAHSASVPRYTLMLVTGAELRAWLASYAHRIMSDEHVYSLYGLSYLLNTLNNETPLGYLEFSSGISVEDDAVFTLILADDPNAESILRPYLDESWMSFEDRVVADFSMPQPTKTETSDVYRYADPFVAFFESFDEIVLKHESGWYII